MRTTLVPLTVLAVLIAVGAAAIGSAGAQFDDASIQLRVVDGDGNQLGADRPFCAVVRMNGDLHVGAVDFIPSDPDASYPVRSGVPLHVGAVACGDNRDSFVSMWS